MTARVNVQICLDDGSPLNIPVEGSTAQVKQVTGGLTADACLFLTDVDGELWMVPRSRMRYLRATPALELEETNDE